MMLEADIFEDGIEMDNRFWIGDNDSMLGLIIEIFDRPIRLS